MIDPNNPSVQFDLPKNQSSVIKVFGVGGGGSNAVNYMYEEGIRGVDFVVCNTDAQALDASPIPNKVQLGISLTEGLGAGANPEVGAKAAEESIAEIEKLLESNTKMVFVTAGMGGGTGTGAAPVIAKVAKDLGILTVGICTSPFIFEGSTRQKQAEEGIDRLRQNVDSLIVINNNKLREVYGNLGFKAGFSKADEVLATAARGIAEVITHHFTTNIDLRDAKTVLADSGTAIMGSGMAEGENRAHEAIKDALNSPLLNDNHIYGARNVLLLIISGAQEITIDEISEISEFVQREAGGNTNIILGIGEDESIQEAIGVTIIATGFAPEQQGSVNHELNKRIVHPLVEDQPITQVLSEPKREEQEVFNSPIQSAPPVSQNNPEEPIQSEEPLKNELESSFDNQPEQQVMFSLDGIGMEEEPEASLPAQELEQEETVESFEEIPEASFQQEPEAPLQQEPEAPLQQDIVEENPIEEPQPQAEDITFVIHDLDEELTETVNVVEEPVQELEEEQEDVISEEQFHAEITEEPKEEVEERKVIALEDYVTFEKQLNESAASQPASKSTEEQVEPELRFEQKTTIDPEAPDGDNLSGSDPFERPISESAQKIAENRKARLEGFNYRFKNGGNIKDVESIPAFRRQGLDIDAEARPSQEDQTGQMSVDEDGLKSNNRFLHDNVD